MNMNSKRSVTFALGMAVVIGWPYIAAANDDFEVSVRVDAASEHNSNVSVSELEQATGESDRALVLDFAVDAHWKPKTAMSVDFGYNYSDRRYREFSEFDLAMHLLYGDVSYDFSHYTWVLTTTLPTPNLAVKAYEVASGGGAFTFTRLVYLLTLWYVRSSSDAK